VSSNHSDNDVEIETRVGSHPISLENVSVTSNRRGRPVIYGDARNNGKVKCNLFLKGTFYDINRRPLGSAMASVSDLASEDVMTFEMNVHTDVEDYRRVVVQIDALL
jgi:hypothetical protein